jgi:hypothetical protein
MDSMEYFNYVCGLKTNGESCRREIKSRISIEENPFYQQIGLKFKEEANEMVHLVHSFVWY